MTNIFNRIPAWIKNISVILVILFLGFLGLRQSAYNFGRSYISPNYGMYTSDAAAPAVGLSSSSKMASTTMYPQAGEYYGADERKFQTDTSYSIQVKKVKDVITTLETKAKELGGFLVSKDIRTPDGAENGYVSVRIPNDKVDDFKKTISDNSVKIVSEYSWGNDITKQYVDTAERLRTYEATKAIYEQMLNKATAFDDILRAQQLIIQTQDQIDALKGDMQYLDGQSKTTLITVNLSTDEYELPLAPSQAFRPEAEFKNAVRSLLVTLRQVAYAVIWLAVYAVVLIPAFLLGKFVWKKFIKRG